MKDNCVIKLWGTTTIGSKWQIVIPKNIRDAISLSPWDEVVMLYSTENKHISIIKNDDINKLFEHAKTQWIRIE